MKPSLLLVAILTVSCYSVEIKQGPSNASSLLGREAFFNCTVSLDYMIIIWLLNDNPVLTIVANHPIITNERFRFRNYTSELGYTAELIISSVELSDTGKVTCNLQSAESHTAFLDVQVNGSLHIANTSVKALKNTTVAVVCKASGWLPPPEMTWLANDSLTDPKNSVIQITERDDGLYDTVSTLNITANFTTVLTCMATIEALSSPQSVTVTLTIVAPSDRSSVIIIAVTGSITGILVLILIIGAIVYCVQQFRQPRSTYQEEVRKASSKKKAVASPAGQVNPGFSHNDSSFNFNSGYSVSSNENSTIYYYRNKELDNIDVSQVPDVVQKLETFQTDSKASRSLNDYHYAASPQKIRHVTAV
ncbi:immunoglobulin superfamily member 5 [Protopterus annectens]|uniref:immunoglobulin superfamily member 5 n=1 Tax=Protopterus annectens TaxID=7888 RepID=UPI001CFB46F2|nr:immunoglobulin superfamily member 5 [Protopterus annectens]